MQSAAGPKLLVTIACHGERNLEFLKRLIRTYRQMAMPVDVVVVSDRLKDLGPEIEVVVGAPTSNPWSLPFAHKAILADRVDRYDLFAYSEDDMLVTEANVRAFLEVTPSLGANEIAGFLRYEIDTDGQHSFPDAHGSYHWIPESVRRRGKLTVAEFSCEHAAFYLLTRDQLERAIASGGFLQGPREGRYDMLCTAATDPYTVCGFRKVVCISRLDSFVIHHLSNRYAGRLGMPRSLLEAQVKALAAISRGEHPASSLCRVECDLSGGEWSKRYDETAREEVIELIPREATKVLYVGSGWGNIDEVLVSRGHSLTVLPLDSVVGATAEDRGSQVLYGTLDESLRNLDGKCFDAVLCTSLLHLLPSPDKILGQLCRLVGEGGVLVLSGPNFAALKLWIKRILRRGDLARISDPEKGGVHMLGPRFVERHATRHGLEMDRVSWLGRSSHSRLDSALGRYGAGSWTLRATRRSKAQ